jgi:hypothetical protein
MTAPVFGARQHVAQPAGSSLHARDTTMKKIKKLGLQRETVRQLEANELRIANGGLSYKHCSYGLTGCGACGPQQPSLRFSNCQGCASDICTFE